MGVPPHSSRSGPSPVSARSQPCFGSNVFLLNPQRRSAWQVGTVSITISISQMGNPRCGEVSDLFKWSPHRTPAVQLPSVALNRGGQRIAQVESIPGSPSAVHGGEVHARQTVCQPRRSVRPTVCRGTETPGGRRSPQSRWRLRRE